MPFVPINSGEVAPGAPLTSNLGNKIKENFDNLHGRVTTLENAGTGQLPPITFHLQGNYSGLTVPRLELSVYPVNTNIKILGVFLIIHTAGSSGVTEIDIRKRSGNNPPVSIFNTRPSVNASAGNFAISNNGVINTAQNTCLPGDLLIFDLTAKQGGSPVSFTVRVDWEYL